MSTPPRIDRKELKTPDQFVTRGRALLEKLFQQRSRFLPVLILGGTVVALVYAYEWWNSSRRENQWTAYQEIQKAPEAERWDKLKTFHQEHSSGRPALFAAVALADHYFDEAKKEALKDPGNVPSAVPSEQWYAKALLESSLLSGEKQLLHVNRGSALEMQKKWDEAQKEFQTAVDLQGEAKGLAMLSLARVYEAKNETEKAVQTYEKISADFMNSEYAKLAKSSVRRLKSPLFKTPNS